MKLDLDQFAGRTPGPWICFYVNSLADPAAFATKGAAEACALFAAQETAGNVETLVMPAALAEAAPALLALARQQRDDIARLRGALESTIASCTDKHARLSARAALKVAE